MNRPDRNIHTHALRRRWYDHYPIICQAQGREQRVAELTRSNSESQAFQRPSDSITEEMRGRLRMLDVTIHDMTPSGTRDLREHSALRRWEGSLYGVMS